MSDNILQLCILSVLCGAVMSLMPEGGSKMVGQILCTAILVISILSPVMELDFESYALESARLREIEAAFSENAQETGDRLNSVVIQRQYREYILDKAIDLGMEELDVQVQVRWSAEGFWVPYSAELKGSWDESQKKDLEDVIRDDLGITKERQYWKRG